MEICTEKQAKHWRWILDLDKREQEYVRTHPEKLAPEKISELEPLSSEELNKLLGIPTASIDELKTYLKSELKNKNVIEIHKSSLFSNTWSILINGNWTESFSGKDGRKQAEEKVDKLKQAPDVEVKPSTSLSGAWSVFVRGLLVQSFYGNDAQLRATAFAAEILQ